MSQMPRIFAALSDPYRFEIIERLMREGELSAGQIGDGFDISAPAISRHLSVLHDAELVTRRVNGQRRLYSLRADAFRQVVDWTQNYRAFWEASLDRLEDVLRQEER